MWNGQVLIGTDECGVEVWIKDSDDWGSVPGLLVWDPNQYDHGDYPTFI